jgi:hypothetical protein
MTVLVVFESHWGNTEQVARAIAGGLRESSVDVRIASVDEAPRDLGGVDLLIVGGPTHAFSLSRRRTREDADRRGSTTGVVETGLRDYLNDVAASDAHPPLVAFDTKVSHPTLPGSAARGAVRLAKRQGFEIEADPETFWVHDVAGPLDPGQLDRARQWGHELAAHARALG